MSASPLRAQRGFSALSACSTHPRGNSWGGFSSRSFTSSRGCRAATRGRTLGAGGRQGLQSGGAHGGSGPSLCPAGGIQEVTINQSLLTPLKIEIDPQFQAVRTQETSEIRTLNNQFASFIDKVRFLEQQNKFLETKWALIQQQGQSHGPRNLESYFESYLAQLRRRLEELQRDRGALDAELKSCQDQEEEYKAKFEQEAQRRTTVENDFVVLKKDTDEVFLRKMELEDQLESLRVHTCFLRRLYEEELGQLRTQAGDMSVVLSMDNNRCLDFSDLIADIRARYEEVTQTSKAEAETLFKTKYQELQESAQLQGDNIKASKIQITQLQQAIQRLQSQMENLKKQNASLQASVTDAEQRGELALKDARAKLEELEAALKAAKQDMAQLLRDYQELMCTKLALDVEIATYRRLLEGEESRMSGACTSQVTISVSGGSAGVSGGAVGGPGGPGGTCGLGGGRGHFGPSCFSIVTGCSSVVTGGSSAFMGSGQGSGKGSLLGSCSVSGSGLGSGSSSSSVCHTILKKTVESSLKTSVTY